MSKDWTNSNALAARSDYFAPPGQLVTQSRIADIRASLLGARLDPIPSAIVVPRPEVNNVGRGGAERGARPHFRYAILVD